VVGYHGVIFFSARSRLEERGSDSRDCIESQYIRKKDTCGNLLCESNATVKCKPFARRISRTRSLACLGFIGGLAAMNPLLNPSASFGGIIRWMIRAFTMRLIQATSAAFSGSLLLFSCERFGTRVARLVPRAAVLGSAQLLDFLVLPNPTGALFPELSIIQGQG
jgi:hypothetical protein